MRLGRGRPRVPLQRGCGSAARWTRIIAVPLLPCGSASAPRRVGTAAQPPGPSAPVAARHARSVAARALVDDTAGTPAPAGDGEAPKTRVFISRGARKEGATPAAPGATEAARPAAAEQPRTFGRFQRDADGNFARPGGPPKNPDGPSEGRPQQRFNDGGGFRGAPAGGRFGAPAPGRGGPGGPNGGRGAGRDSDREKGRRGRVDDGPAVSGRMATEARRNARASRKEERDAKVTKKERVEFLEVPAEGMPLEVLAEKLAVNSADVIKALFMKGIMTTVNMVLDKEKVLMVAEAFEVEVLEEDAVTVDAAARKTTTFTEEDDLEFLEPRAPVVTIMGHVDHGKTSLLDYIRKTRVAAGEAGGITQAIGAYQVAPLINGTRTPITFLDTPGHEAFSAMRARGARVTDVAVIMVAADDGVRPQTLEAISHAQSAGVPMVVALNKIDKEGANPERVKQELSAAGLLPEEWGGQTPVVPISAKKGTGIDSLLETLQLVAELAELSANPQRAARGTVVEAYLDKARGATATLLVQTGTLRVGDVVICGPSYGRVRALLSDTGERVQEAGPSTPVQMLGLDCVPGAGDIFDVCADEDEARERAEEARSSIQAARLVEQSSGQAQRVLLNTGGAPPSEEDDESLLKRLNVVLKTDVSGSLEAVKAATGAISQDRVQLRFLTAAAGEVTASDIDLASASGALVLAFNVPLQDDIVTKAKQRNVDVRSYDIIYALVDDVKAAMEAMLKPVTERVPLGEAEVRGVFASGASGKVAGCLITSGKLVSKCMITVKRGKEVVYEGQLDSLRRMKEVVKELGSGYECGVGSDFSGWKEGDKIEAFELRVKRVILPMRGEVAPAAAERAAATATAAAA